MQSSVFTSPNIARKIIDKESILERELVDLVLQLPYSDKKGVFRVDREFLIEFAITAEVIDEENAFDVYSLLKPVCSGCFQDAIENNV